jgi:tetratricopeptide (TPR) repeat protein
MKKITLLCVGFLSLLSLQAQQTYTYSNPARAFQEGKEQYLQQQFSASEHSLQTYLQSADPLDKSKIQEAEYLLAADAYELRQENAVDLLKTHLEKYPGTPMLDNVKFRLGILLFEHKQYATAIKELDKVDLKKLNSSDENLYHFALGYCYTATNDFAKARDQFKPLIGVEKYDKTANYYYGYCEYALGNYDTALPYFETIQNQPEFSPLAPYYIIQIYAKQKEYDKVKSYGKTILEINPNNPKNEEVYRIMGECAYRDQDYKLAITDFAKAYATDKQLSRTSFYMWGVSCIQAGAYDQAVLPLTKVAGETDALGQNAYLALGNAYNKTNDRLKAQMAYANAGKLTFDKKVQEEAVYNYALSTYESNAQFGESVKAFDNFLLSFPDSKYADEINSRLATALIQSKDYTAALNAINKLKTNNAQVVAAKENILFHLGVEQFDKKNYKGAISNLTKALDVTSGRPSLVQIYYWRGESYYRTGQYALAEKDFDTYQDDPRSTRDANFHLSYYALAYCKFLSHDYKQSLLSFMRFAGGEHEALSPAYIDALIRIGDCYYMTRDFINAHKYYAQVVAKGKAGSDYAEYQIAFLYGLQKNYRGKITELNKMIENFPTSNYIANAYYEIGRSYIIIEQYDKAIETYNTLIKKFPNSELTRKAALEIGLAYTNTNKKTEALAEYKKVVSNYPGSSEAKVAMENIENLYVDQSDAAGYVTYRRSLGKSTDLTTVMEDSLVYTTAEKVYLNGKLPEASTLFADYLAKYCPQGNYCIKATYYLADSYMQQKKTDEALASYRKLTEIEGNPYMEQALAQCASITYDKQDYAASLGFFKTLEATTSNKEYHEAASLGVLRCSHLTNDHPTTVKSANQIINNSLSPADMVVEARFYRAKAFLAENKQDSAFNDLSSLSKNVRTVFGAEAKYELANYYFQKQDLKKSEAEIMNFINLNTPYQYWLAKSFILLSDIYVKRGDSFQAKQYLLTLQDNYHQQDDILSIVKQKLQAIENAAKPK